jgi:DNA polymerase-3 subunit gamma/tau
MLLKGIQETQMAPAPLQALEMILIRLVHASTLPSPEEAIKALKKNMPAAHAHGGGAGASAAGAMGGANATAVASSATVQTSGHDGPHMQATGTFGAAGWGIGWPQHVQALPMQAQAQMQPAPKPDLHLVADNVGFAAPPVPTPSAPPVAQPTSLDDVARLCEYHEEKLLADQVRRSMHLVAFDAGRIEFKPTEGAQKNLAQTLTKRLSEWTGQRWVVVVSGKTGEDTLYKRNYNKAESNPIVQAVLAAFPGAKIEFIKDTSESPLPVAQFTAEPDVDMDADIIEDFDAFDI